MIEDIKKLIESRDELAKRAFVEYEPIVDNIISSKTKDVNKICYTMDYILDFCFDDKVLLHYRKLCRYLYDIGAHDAAADYVNYYREMWDEKGEKFGNNKKIR